MENAKLSWLQLTNIQIGGVICLPVIMVGQLLAKNFGFLNAIGALIIGNILLLTLGLVAVKMSVKTRLTTLENAAHYFGKYGTQLFALVMILCLTGWFAIQLNLMSLSLNNIVALAFAQSPLSSIMLNIFLGVLIMLFALRGITALDKIAAMSTPLLIATMGSALFSVIKTAPALMPVASHSKGILEAISLVIATSIAVIADLPTFYRFARTKKDGYISIIVLFLLAVPAIEFVGVYLGAYSSGETIIDTLLVSGGALWQLWVGLFLVLAGWTTNNMNLYSAAVCGQMLAPSSSQASRTLFLGSVAIALACFDLINNLEFVLEVMGVMVTSMAALMFTSFLLREAGITILHMNRVNIICWFLATLFGFLTLFKVFSFTGMVSIDTWIAATCILLCVVLVNIFVKRKLK